MSRTISTALKNTMASEVPTLAICVTMVRTDGVVFGFTGHDQDIVYNGVTYEASNAIAASGSKQQIGTEVGNTDFVGLLRSDRITETDILAGRFDGAAIVEFLVNYRNLTQGSMILQSGTMGEVRTQDGKFTAELRGLSQRLTQQLGELCSPTCRALFCDARCGLSVATYRFTLVVSAVIDAETVVVTGLNAATANFYAYGIMEYLGTAPTFNAGVGKEIKGHTAGGTLTLKEPFPFPVSVGDSVRLTRGCDKTMPTCSGTYRNGVNYRGEPYVPGGLAISQVGRGQL